MIDGPLHEIGDTAFGVVGDCIHRPRGEPGVGQEVARAVEGSLTGGDNNHEPTGGQALGGVANCAIGFAHERWDRV